MARRINMVDLARQYREAREHMPYPPEQLLAEGQYIGGKVVEALEKKWSEYCGTQHSVAVSSGTDALTATFAGLCHFYRPRRTAVITQANTFIATPAAALRLPDVDVFIVDCDADGYIDADQVERLLRDIDRKYDEKIVVPVHMYGIPPHKNLVSKLNYLRDSQRFARIVEDASHAHGAQVHDGKKVGSLWDAAAFSCFPAKPLGAAGDAGLVTTDMQFVADFVSEYRNVGRQKGTWNTFSVLGCTARMDTIQASVLLGKLALLDVWRNARSLAAQRYQGLLKEADEEGEFFRPLYPGAEDMVAAWYAYPVYFEKVSAAQVYRQMEEYGIPTRRYYPEVVQAARWAVRDPRVHVYGQTPNAVKLCRHVLCLPIHEYLDASDQEAVIAALAKCGKSVAAS